LVVAVRATNGAGQRQPEAPIFTAPGYHNNASPKITLRVV
jgi:hypothetical protein